jgi:hypothetical protein
MNKKLLGIAVVLMAVAMLATPVMAIGPMNPNAVEKNKNLSQVSYGVGLYPPLGTHEAINNEWLPETATIFGVAEHDMWIDAARYYRGNAFVIPNTDTPPVPYQVYQMDNENKWLYLDQDVFEIMMGVWGFDPNVIPFIVAMYPQGIYYKWNLVGQ